MGLRSFFLALLTIAGCSSTKNYEKHVDQLDRDRFMGKWYVQAGRFTMFEKDAFNAVEIYTWNEKKQQIDVDFRFNEGSFTGPEKKIPQIAFIEKHKSNARWQVRPFWPLLFDYRVIALDAAYDWTVIGVPSQKYVWIMSRSAQMSREKIAEILGQIKALGYRVDEIEYVQHLPTE